MKFLACQFEVCGAYSQHLRGHPVTGSKSPLGSGTPGLDSYFPSSQCQQSQDSNLESLVSLATDSIVFQKAQGSGAPPRIRFCPFGPWCQGHRRQKSTR